MLKQTCAVLLVLLFSLAVVSIAQDKDKAMAKKGDNMEMSKGEKEMGPLKSISCDPKCGFMVRSHSEKEILSITKAHAKKMHNMTMTDAQVKDMMKTEDAGAKQ